MALSGWPTVTDDTGTKQDGTIFSAALVAAIKASIEGALDDANYVPQFEGLVVGFAGAGAADEAQVGDANFKLDFDGGGASAPSLTFATTDLLYYDRGADAYHFQIASADVGVLDADGLQLPSGLVVGYVGTPVADEVRVGDATFKLDFDGGGASIPSLQFDADDRLDFDRANSRFQFVIGGAEVARISSSFGFAGFKGADVASAAAIVPTGNLFHVTGTTNITSITSTGIPAGTRITIIFDGVLTFTDGSNLKLAGNFVTTADDSITLDYDGTSWFEAGRSVN